MNNIYKVIWSKAKNCYVVASEIARSHTKSATGSEKIGGVTRRSLLASLMALSLLCGGLGVASAADGTVNVDESTPGTAVVYTTEGTQLYVEGKLGDYYTKDKVDEKLVDLKGDVTTNKNNIGDLQTKTANLDGTELTGMTTVETGALKVTGQISNGTVNTALADINDSMTQTKTNKEDIANLKTTTGDQDTAIKDLQKKTTNISYADGAGTSIDGITVKDGNIVGNGNSAITGLANVETNTIKTGSINGKSLTGTTVATATDVAAETLARKEADNKLEEKINEEKTARKGKDNELEGKITKNTQDIAKLDENGVKYDTAVKDTITLKGPDSTKITNLKDADLSDSSTDAVTGKQLNKTNEDLKTEAQTRKDMDTSLSNRADALEKNTGGITRNDAESKTIIEKSVTVDSKGNVTADGKLKGEGVDAGAGAITTTGAVNAGSLNVTNGATSLKETTVNGALTAKENATFQKDVTANSFSVNGKTYIDSDGLNANNQVIRNVADGSISEGSKDAVNGGQLYNVKNDLEGKVNKVGANAAAMANLHPMEFDPDSKWNVAAAIGNYGSETAAALGAFYRPNDDVMVNLSTAFGTGENMVGGGVSVRLGKGGNKLSREENNALKDQVNDLTARMDALLSVLNPNMSKDFPDVPENHWAYEAVSRLAGNDIVQGYPDGEFHGERTMTRYEMAEIIYNALSRGAEAEKELVEEFKPELQAMAASEKATAERAEG